MIVYKGMTWCSRKDCAKSSSCPRFFSELEQERAETWWGSQDYPLALSEFTECYVPSINKEDNNE